MIWEKVLLCKRQGEENHDETFTFIGGKMEITDFDINAGLKREKDDNKNRPGTFRKLVDTVSF